MALGSHPKASISALPYNPHMPMESTRSGYLGPIVQVPQAQYGYSASHGYLAQDNSCWVVGGLTPALGTGVCIPSQNQSLYLVPVTVILRICLINPLTRSAGMIGVCIPKPF